jgi:hypothetical protein
MTVSMPCNVAHSAKLNKAESVGHLSLSNMLASDTHSDSRILIMQLFCSGVYRYKQTNRLVTSSLAMAHGMLLEQQLGCEAGIRLS